MEDIIKRYLTQSTGFALMIDGKWGSGKTYYVEHSLKKLIESSEINKKLLYTSANGITSFDEITTQILIENYNLNKSGAKAIKLTYELGKVALKSSEKYNIISEYIDSLSKVFKSNNLINFNDKVIIIDDIERINFIKLPIDDFLGKINSLFTEHEKIKVILVCDENELLKKMGNEMCSHYKIIKEKSIWRTITFEQDLDGIVKYLVSNIHLNEKRTLQLTSIYIQELILHTGEKNIRNIKFFLEILTEIINTITFDKYRRINKQIILFTLVVCKDYKEGFANTPEYLENFNIISVAVEKYTTFDTSIKNNELLKEKALRARYSNLKIYIPSIYKFISTAKLDPNEINKEVDDLINNLDATRECNLKLNNLIDFRSLSNEEFDKTLNTVIKFIENGEYDIYSLLQFIHFNIYFIENGVGYQFDNIDKLIDFILANIDKSFKNTKIIYTILDRELKEKENKYPRLKEILDRYSSAVKEIMYEELNISAIQIQNELVMSIDSMDDSKFKILFSNLEASKMDLLLEKYISDNGFADRFNQKLKKEWNLEIIQDAYINMKDNIFNFYKILKTKSTNNKSLTSLFVNELGKNLKERNIFEE